MTAAVDPKKTPVDVVHIAQIFDLKLTERSTCVNDPGRFRIFCCTHAMASRSRVPSFWDLPIRGVQKYLVAVIEFIFELGNCIALNLPNQTVYR